MHCSLSKRCRVSSPDQHERSAFKFNLMILSLDMFFDDYEREIVDSNVAIVAMVELK